MKLKEGNPLNLLKFLARLRKRKGTVCSGLGNEKEK
jgi:hypothetical protein